MNKKTVVLTGLAWILTFAGGCRWVDSTPEPRSTTLPAQAGAPIDQPPSPAAPGPQTQGAWNVGPGGTALRPTPAGLDQAKLSASVPPPKSRDGYQSLGFDQLSQYPYELNDDGSIGNLPNGKRSEIPQDIKKLDGKKVALSGFVIPISYQDTKPTLFALAKNQMLCFFGQSPKANEWAIVTMKNPVEITLDEPVAVSGTLHVGEVVEEGVVLCLYRLEGETVAPTSRQ